MKTQTFLFATAYAGRRYRCLWVT